MSRIVTQLFTRVHAEQTLAAVMITEHHHRLLDAHMYSCLCAYESIKEEAMERGCVCVMSLPLSVCLLCEWLTSTGTGLRPLALAGRHAWSTETRLSPGSGGGPACDARNPSLACSLLSSVWPLTPPLPIFLSIHFITCGLPFRPRSNISFSSLLSPPFPPLYQYQSSSSSAPCSVLSSPAPLIIFYPIITPCRPPSPLSVCLSISVSLLMKGTTRGQCKVNNYFMMCCLYYSRVRNRWFECHFEGHCRHRSSRKRVREKYLELSVVTF